MDLKLEGGVNVFSRPIHVPFLHTLYMRFMMDNLDEELKIFEVMMICAGFVYIFLFIHIYIEGLAEDFFIVEKIKEQKDSF